MNMIDVLYVFLASALILLFYFLPFVHLRRWSRLSPTEAAVLSFGAGSLIFGAGAFITHAFDLNQPLTHGAILAVLALSAIPGLSKALSQLRRVNRCPAVRFLSLVSLIMLLQAAFPIYIGGFWYFDWWQNYSLAQMYMGKIPHDYLWLGIYNFASRTPLMNLNAAFFLSIFGDSFWVFQVVATILNSVFLLPVYLLCHRLAGEKAASMIGALIILSPSIIHNSWYPWPKLYAAYFVLLAAYFYLKHREENYIPDNSICMLIFMLIWSGFSVHQSSLFSSIVILIDMLFRALRKDPKRFLLLAVAGAFCFAVINGAWFAWAMNYFGIKSSLISYYERPAATGGLSGYLILLTYHILATICSPLFVHDLAGKQFDILVFFQNMEALYYNSLAGLGTITVFIAALAVLAKRVTSAHVKAGYAGYALRGPGKLLLSLLGIWAFAMAAMILISPGFGDAVFSRYFNHPQFARKMFIGFFLAGSVGIGAPGILLWLSRRSKEDIQGESPARFPAALLFWMAIAGYAGGILMLNELYIHGTISASSATAVLLTVLLLARICSDVSRTKRFLLAIPIFCESFLITWLPLFIIRNGWGWADEKNWQLKEKYSLVFMADLFPNIWWVIALAGLAIQAAMLVVWIRGSATETTG